MGHDRGGGKGAAHFLGRHQACKPDAHAAGRRPLRDVLTHRALAADDDRRGSGTQKGHGIDQHVVPLFLSERRRGKQERPGPESMLLAEPGRCLGVGMVDVQIDGASDDPVRAPGKIGRGLEDAAGLRLGQEDRPARPAEREPGPDVPGRTVPSEIEAMHHANAGAEHGQGGKAKVSRIVGDDDLRAMLEQRGTKRP